MQVRTRYCFAGGRASEPLVKVELYFCEDASRFSWMALMLREDWVKRDFYVMAGAVKAGW